MLECLPLFTNGKNLLTEKETMLKNSCRFSDDLQIFHAVFSSIFSVMFG